MRRPPNVEDIWLFLHLVFEGIWKFRFLYRDINELLSRNRMLETHFKRIVAQIQSLKVMTLSAYQGKEAKPSSVTTFPAFGKTDADVFGDNLLEVMKFVFNHTTFDPKDELDQALLAAYKPLGVEPGKEWDAAKAANIDGALFRQVQFFRHQMLR